MEVCTEQASATVRLSSALLLYEGENGACYATAHPIELLDEGGRPVIGAGRPVDRCALISALESLAESAAPAARFLPATVLGISASAVTWWHPPSRRRVFFECDELGKRAAVVPHPGLVFQAANTGFRVFAVKGDTRPLPDTPLFEPPYFNTWNHGAICIGTAPVPSKVDVDAISGWEAGFFDSAFTHPNGGGKRVEYAAGEFAFWRDMLDGKFKKTFPEECLVPTQYVASDLATGKIRGNR